MIYTSEVNESADFRIISGLFGLISLSCFMFMCLCFHKTRDSLRLRLSDIDSCFRKKRFYWSRSDSNNNAAKTGLNGSLGNITASSNGYLRVGNANQSANCSPEILHLVKTQVSRDRELPPVPPQATNSPPTHYASISKTSSHTGRVEHHEYSYEEYEPLPHLPRSATSCSDTAGLREVKLRSGRNPRDSVTQQQMMSVCDTESEIDPLYSSVLPQGQSSRNSFRSNSQIWRASMTGQENPLNNVKSPANDSNTNHVYGSVWPKNSGGPPLYARIFKSKAERLSRVGSPPRYTPSSCVKSNASPYEDIVVSGPTCRCMPPSDSFSSIAGPPVPPRSYGQSEVDLVAESRLEDFENPIRRHHPNCSFSIQEIARPSSCPKRDHGLRVIPIRNLEAIPGSPRRFSQPVFGSSSSGDSPTTSTQTPEEPQTTSKSNSHLNSAVFDGTVEDNNDSVFVQPENNHQKEAESCRPHTSTHTSNQIYETLYEGVYSESSQFIAAPKLITLKHRNISFDASSDAYDEIGGQKNGNLYGNNSSVFILQEMKTFRHMDSDVDLSKACSPLTVPGTPTSCIISQSDPSKHIYSYVRPVNKTVTSKSPYQVVEGRLASNEDLSRPHTPQQASSYNLIGYIAKPVMTPLMERSIEGSLLDETVSSGIDPDDKSPGSDSYSFLEDFTSGLHSLDCRPNSGHLASSVNSTDTASSFYAALSAATSLSCQPYYYSRDRNRTESEASSLL